jgi:hypothetical protein
MPRDGATIIIQIHETDTKSGIFIPSNLVSIIFKTYNDKRASKRNCGNLIKYMAREGAVSRELPIPDCRVHAWLYFIPPSGHGLRYRFQKNNFRLM